MAADFEILEQARDDAAELTANADFWTDAAYARLRDILQKDQFFKANYWTSFFSVLHSAYSTTYGLKAEDGGAVRI